MTSPTASPQPGQGLRQALAARHVAMISIGGIVGAGLFVGSSAPIAAIGPAIVLSYALAGVLILAVMRMLAEMAVAQPGVRSFVQFTRQGLGPAAGFIAGWLYWYFWTIVVPVEAIAGAVLLQGWFPAPTWLLGLLLIGVMTAVNLMSARSYGEFEFWFASIKIAAILAFVALAGAHVAHHRLALHNLTAFGGFVPHGALSVVAGVTTVFFSLTGAEIITVAAAESVDPRRALARMATSVVSRLLLFYIASVLLIVTVIPWRSVIPGQSPFTQALLGMGYGWAGEAMNVVILTAVLSCLNSAFYVTSRVLFTLAGNGDAPAALVKLNRRGVPSRSVLIGSLAGALGVLAASWSSASQVFAFLVNASGALILFVYLLTALAQIRQRRERERAADAGDRATPVLQMPWFPWSSYLAVAGIVAVLVAMALTPGLASQFYASLATLALATAVAALRMRRRADRPTVGEPQTSDAGR